jgi:hypothetical protein
LSEPEYQLKLFVAEHLLRIRALTDEFAPKIITAFRRSSFKHDSKAHLRLCNKVKQLSGKITGKEWLMMSKKFDDKGIQKLIHSISEKELMNVYDTTTLKLTSSIMLR